MKKKSSQFKGLTPNKAQRRPGAPVSSPVKPFSINGVRGTPVPSRKSMYRPQGR